MGKVYQVEECLIRPHPNNMSFNHDLQQYVMKGEWSTEYDTCYFKHHTGSKDEFCIKDPAKQILRWVIVIEAPHDRKLSAYVLDTELLDSGLCGCC
jgi:hypothetical protein